MFFNSFFKKKNEGNQESKPTERVNSIPIVSTPSVQYVHTSGNREKTSEKENNVIVLWWISKKKKGYDKTSNKFPKWFASQYGIDFNLVMNDYVKKGMLLENDSIVMISQTGEEHLQELDYIIYIHEHPQYCLCIDDFKNSHKLHVVRNADLTWGIFNSRIIEYTKKAMWTSLAANYSNMASLLIEEEKYDKAIEFIFPTVYLETSGMQDNNELTAIMAECTNSGWKNKYLPNGMPDIFLLEINNYYVTVPFRKVQDHLRLEWEEIKNRFLDSVHIRSLESILPFRYFEKEQSFEIFKQAIDADGKKGIFRLSECNKKLKWNTPNENSRAYFYASVENQVNRRFGKP